MGGPVLLHVTFSGIRMEALKPYFVRLIALTVHENARIVPLTIDDNIHEIDTQSVDRLPS
jgi:hypothetical protein